MLISGMSLKAWPIIYARFGRGVSRRGAAKPHAAARPTSFAKAPSSILSQAAQRHFHTALPICVWRRREVSLLFVAGVLPHTTSHVLKCMRAKKTRRNAPPTAHTPFTTHHGVQPGTPRVCGALDHQAARALDHQQERRVAPCGPCQSVVPEHLGRSEAQRTRRQPDVSPDGCLNFDGVLLGLRRPRHGE